MRSGRGCQRLLVLWFLGAVALGAPRARGDACRGYPLRRQSGCSTGATCPACVDFVPVGCAGTHESRRFHRICLARGANVATGRRLICLCSRREPDIDERYAPPVGPRRLRTKAHVLRATPIVRPSEASNPKGRATSGGREFVMPAVRVAQDAIARAPPCEPQFSTMKRVSTDCLQ